MVVCWRQAKEKANRVEEQLQELTSKLAAMETEKHSLAARNKVLETALATAKGMPSRVCFRLWFMQSRIPTCMQLWHISEYVGRPAQLVSVQLQIWPLVVMEGGGVATIGSKLYWQTLHCIAIA